MRFGFWFLVWFPVLSYLCNLRHLWMVLQDSFSSIKDKYERQMTQITQIKGYRTLNQKLETTNRNEKPKLIRR
jgi:hypothetical protein